MSLIHPVVVEEELEAIISRIDLDTINNIGGEKKEYPKIRESIPSLVLIIHNEIDETG